jgi:hypothetical protein
VALASSDRFQRSHGVDSTEGPPPRTTYGILESNSPKLLAVESGEAGEPTAIPVRRTIGAVRTFGRETDRPARVELRTNRGHHFDQALAALRELGEECVGALVSEEKVGTVDVVRDLMAAPWIIDQPLVTREIQTQIGREVLRILSEQWIHKPLQVLHGLTPAEAADDAARRLRLEALITLLDSSLPFGNHPDLNELRHRLGLPLPAAIDPQVESVNRLSIVRIGRVLVEKLKDRELTDLWRRAVLSNVRPTVLQLGREVIRRESLRARDPGLVISALEVLSELEPHTDRQLECLEQARTLADANGQVLVSHALIELRIRLDRGEAEGARRVAEHIMTNYSDDVDVMAACLRLLQRYGVMQAEEDSSATQVYPRAVPPPGRTTSDAPRIWTPDQQRAARGQKTIWTPGSG